MEISYKLKSLRNRNGMTQKEVADKLCVTRQAVSNWETGKTTPDYEILLQIAKIYCVSLNDLFGVEESSFMGGEHSMKNIHEKDNDAHMSKKKFDNHKHYKNFVKYIDALPFAGLIITIFLFALFFASEEPISIQMVIFGFIPLIVNVVFYVPIKILLKERDKDD